MAVDLSPVSELDLDEELLEFVGECYCANCRFFERPGEAGSAPHCARWDEDTRVEVGYVCAEYVPMGYPD